MLKEFKEFINNGNVLDLAVAVIIGAAFGKIVSSMVEDILMPVIGSMFSVNIPGWKYVLKEAILGADGAVTTAAVEFRIGQFLQTVIDFILVAFPIFLIIKAVNKAKKTAPPAPPAPPAPAAPSSTDTLLTEIRDLLKR